jgi:S-adenosylmethionine hydrolase
MKTTPPLITLLTDFGARDAYVAVMKTVILGLCPDARIVDLTHEIAPQDIEEAAFLLSTVWPYCPDGTVHLIVVDPGVGTGRRLLAVSALGQTFIAPDNGVLSYLFAEGGGFRAYSVARGEHFLPRVGDTFHGRDILAPVSARIARGLPIEEVGPQVLDPVRLPLSAPIEKAHGLEVHVIHVDRFGNLITDLTADALDRWRPQASRRRTSVRLGERSLGEIRGTYAEAEPGEPLALFGSSGRLEIAVHGGSAAERLGLAKGDAMLVECGE